MLLVKYYSLPPLLTAHERFQSALPISLIGTRDEQGRPSTQNEMGRWLNWLPLIQNDTSAQRECS